MREIWRVKYSRISSRISESTSSRGLVKLDMIWCSTHSPYASCFSGWQCMVVFRVSLVQVHSQTFGK